MTHTLGLKMDLAAARQDVERARRAKLSPSALRALEDRVSYLADNLERVKLQRARDEEGGTP